MPVSLSQELQSEAYKKISAADPKAMQVAVSNYQLLHNPTNSTGIQRSKSSIKNYSKKFRDAEILYGNGLIGLFPQTKKRGNRNRKIDQDVIDLMNRPDFIGGLFA